MLDRFGSSRMAAVRPLWARGWPLDSSEGSMPVLRGMATGRSPRGSGKGQRLSALPISKQRSRNSTLWARCPICRLHRSAPRSIRLMLRRGAWVGRVPIRRRRISLQRLQAASSRPLLGWWVVLVVEAACLQQRWRQSMCNSGRPCYRRTTSRHRHFKLSSRLRCCPLPPHLLSTSSTTTRSTWLVHSRLE